MVRTGLPDASTASNGLRSNVSFIFPARESITYPKSKVIAGGYARHLRNFRDCGWRARPVFAHQSAAIAAFTISLHRRRCSIVGLIKRERGQPMKIDDIRRTAYSMPLTNP